MSGNLSYDLSIVSLRKLIFESVKENQSYGDIHSVKFLILHNQDDLKVRGDVNRLKQILANLLSNAAKFSPPDSHVEIGINQKQDRARIFVKDNGEGIPDSYKDKIFMRFVQVSSSSNRKHKGAGLGLAISKSIAEHHNGELYFNSSSANGTTFYLELPLLKTE